MKFRKLHLPHSSQPFLTGILNTCPTTLSSIRTTSDTQTSSTRQASFANMKHRWVNLKVFCKCYIYHTALIACEWNYAYWILASGILSVKFKQKSHTLEMRCQQKCMHIQNHNYFGLQKWRPSSEVQQKNERCNVLGNVFNLIRSLHIWDHYTWHLITVPLASQKSGPNPR